MIPESARAPLRRLRDMPLVNAAIRFPFEQLRRRGLRIPRRVFQHLIYRGVFCVELDDDHRFWTCSEGFDIENSLYWDGISAHEPECILLWVALAGESSVVLDIGANTGLFSLAAAAARSDLVVHAFEPVPRIARRLVGNCGLNPGFAIHVHEMAVGSVDGEAVLHDPGGENCYSASLNPDFLPGDRETYSVAVVSGDEFVRARGLASVDLIKIDVEGFEDRVLAGLESTLRRHRPTLVLELLPEGSEATVAALQPLLSFGYRFFHLSEAGPVESGAVGPSPTTRNVLLVHETRPPHIACLQRGASL